VANTAAQSVHLSVIGTPGISFQGQFASIWRQPCIYAPLTCHDKTGPGRESLHSSTFNSSTLSCADDSSHSVARKVDFADKTSVDNSLNVLDASTLDAGAAGSDAASDRAKKLAAWKLQKEKKEKAQRSVHKPGAPARGNPTRDVTGSNAASATAHTGRKDEKEARPERGKESAPSSRWTSRDLAEKDEKDPRNAAPNRRSADGSSPATTGGAAPFAVSGLQAHATPLLERLVRHGVAPVSVSRQESTDAAEVPASPEFPSFASLASRSAVSSLTSAKTPSRTHAPLSASTTSAAQASSSTPAKFAAFSAVRALSSFASAANSSSAAPTADNSDASLHFASSHLASSQSGASSLHVSTREAGSHHPKHALATPSSSARRRSRPPGASHPSL
jgi:hypothetical protein